MKYILIYLAAANLMGFALMYFDKQRARLHHRRIPERTLFLAALLGGSLGAFAGMWLCHHKTRHWYFVAGIPLIIALQIALVLFLRRIGG